MQRQWNAGSAMGASPASTAFARSVKLPGFIGKNRVIWENGGPRERFFHALGWFTVVFLLSAAGLMFWLFWNGLLPYEAFFSFTLAATTYGAFHNAVSMAVMNAKAWKHYTDEGRFQPHDDYFREWIRIIEQEGDRGLFPGAVKWAAFLWAVYYGMILASVPFTLAFPVRLRPAAPWIFAAVDGAIAFTCWLAWQLHMRRIGREVDAKGYRLREYAVAAEWVSASRSQAAFRWFPRTRRDDLTLAAVLVVLGLAIAFAYAIVIGLFPFTKP
jgi:hypothetical protein